MHQYLALVLHVPAATPDTAPVSVTWAVTAGWLHTVRIRIPAGHSGQTGVRVDYQGTTVIPFGIGAWLIDDDTTHEVTWDGEIMARGLVVSGFNTDRYPHAFRLWAHVDPVLPARAEGVPGTPLDTGLSGRVLAQLAALGSKPARRPAAARAGRR